MSQQTPAQLLNFVVTSDQLCGRQKQAVFSRSICRYAGRAMVAGEVKGGRQPLAACRGCHRLGGQNRLFQQAQGGHVGVGHGLNVRQALVLFQGANQRAAVAGSGGQVALAHPCAFV
jgi:hypothetical protein